MWNQIKAWGKEKFERETRSEIWSVRRKKDKIQNHDVFEYF